MLIHCSPSIVDLAMDGEENLIQIPLVPGLGMVTTQSIGIPLTKLQTPLANCFVGQLDASLSHDLFDVAITQGEAVVQPDTITNDRRRESDDPPLLFLSSLKLRVFVAAAGPGYRG